MANKDDEFADILFQCFLVLFILLIYPIVFNGLSQNIPTGCGGEMGCGMSRAFGAIIVPPFLFIVSFIISAIWAKACKFSIVVSFVLNLISIFFWIAIFDMLGVTIF